MSGSFWQYFITLQSLVAIGTMVAKITFSIYCVTSQEQVIKRSCDLMGRSLSWKVTTMTSWVIIDIEIYFLRFKSKVSLARLLPLLLFPHGMLFQMTHGMTRNFRWTEHAPSKHFPIDQIRSVTIYETYVKDTCTPVQWHWPEGDKEKKTQELYNFLHYTQTQKKNRGCSYELPYIFLSKGDRL